MESRRTERTLDRHASSRQWRTAFVGAAFAGSANDPDVEIAAALWAALERKNAGVSRPSNRCACGTRSPWSNM